MSDAIAFIGASGSGKTTLIERLIPELKQQGLAVAAVKHTHHDVDMDRPGKDSWRFREAGARRVLLGTKQWVFTTEPAPKAEDTLELIRRAAAGVDLVLIEGFGRLSVASLEVWRSTVSPEPRLSATDECCLGLVTEEDPPPAWRDHPRYGASDLGELVRAIQDWRDAGRLRIP